METHNLIQNKTIRSDEVPSLLIPIAGNKLLLPTVSVAEMLPFKEPQPAKNSLIDQPNWYLGDVLWRGVWVPMISYEAISGGDIPTAIGVSQMAVLNNTLGHSKLPFICFPTQGIPRLARVTPQSIKQDTSMVGPFDQMAVSINGELAILPDVAKLEQAYIELLAE